MLGSWPHTHSGSTDNAFIINGGTAAITSAIDTPPGATCGSLYLGDTASMNSGTIQMTGGNLSPVSDENVGNLGAGTFIQSGGTNNVGGNLNLANSTGLSSYLLSVSGSLLSATNNENVGNSGMGTFTQSDGSNSISQNLYLGNNPGSSGTYNLGGLGSLYAATAYVGYSGTGTFDQTGGTNNISQSLYLGSNAGSSGAYTLSAGIARRSGE